MTVYHIVLLKLKPNITPEQLSAFAAAANAMVGQVPGLVRLDIGPPLASTAHRAQGFATGLVAVLDKADDVAVYAAHPTHQRVIAIRDEIAEDSLAYDLEF